MKGTLSYSESIYVQFRLNKCILQELWILFACIYTKKMSTTTVTWKILCHWLLAPSMPLKCGLKYSHCSTEWIDVYYKHICGNILMLWNRLFMISTRDKKSLPLGNSQPAKTGYEFCLLYYMVTSIEKRYLPLSMA